MINILCTRKISPQDKYDAERHGVMIDDIPFLKINIIENERAIKFLSSEKNLSIVCTSQHALKFFQANNISTKEKSIFVLQGETQRLAMEMGFNIVGIAENSLRLSQVIIQRQVKKILFLTSNIHLHDMLDELAKHSVEVIKEIVYSKELLDIEIKKKYDGIMFCSPSQVDAFAKRNIIHPALPVFCIGSTTASHPLLKHHSRVIVAMSSSIKEILNQIYHYKF